MPNRADAHDLDKLRRWQNDLMVTPPDAPAVYAVFLVAGTDAIAHHHFRSVRSLFEDRGMGFAHLVIFGQHGLSSTVRCLQEGLGLPADGLPILLVFGGDRADGQQMAIDCLSLPAGDEPDQAGETPFWLAARSWTPHDLGQTGDSVAVPATGRPASLGEAWTESAMPVPKGEAILHWIAARVDASKAAGGPPELNRLLQEGLSLLCQWALARLEEPAGSAPE